jgi:hypothetical protein
MNTPNTDDQLAGELLAALHEAGRLQQELAASNKLVADLMNAMYRLLPVADHENLTVSEQTRIDAAEGLLARIEEAASRKKRTAKTEPEVRPHIIPFGGGVILIGSAVSAEASTIVIRGCRDGYQESDGKTPEEAWEASRGAPEWWLAFTDPADAVGLADKLTLLAYDMQSARITNGQKP